MFVFVPLFVLIFCIIGVFESHSVIARCMGKTCGRAVCGGGDSCHSSGTAWRNPFSETTVKQSEK